SHPWVRLCPRGNITAAEKQPTSFGAQLVETSGRPGNARAGRRVTPLVYATCSGLLARDDRYQDIGMTFPIQLAPARQILAAELLPRPLDELRLPAQVLPVENHHLVPLMNAPAQLAPASPDAVRTAERAGLEVRRGSPDVDRALGHARV